MRKFNKLFLMSLLALVLVASLTACGKGETEDSQKKPNTEVQSSEPESSEKESQPVEDDKVTYTVRVVDEAGNPIANAMAQMCNAENCFLPVATDANGVAEFKMDEDSYKATLAGLPEGYEFAGTPDAEGYYHFEGGSTELTITLKKTA